MIEVLVGFAILSVTAVALFRVFSAGLNNVAVSERYSLATLVAETVLAEVGRELPLAEGESEGERGDGFRWRLVIRPYSDSQLSPELQVRPYAVSVTVSWKESSDGRSVSLATLRYAPRQ